MYLFIERPFLLFALKINHKVNSKWFIFSLEWINVSFTLSVMGRWVIYLSLFNLPLHFGLSDVCLSVEYGNFVWIRLQILSASIFLTVDIKKNLDDTWPNARRWYFFRYKQCQIISYMGIQSVHSNDWNAGYIIIEFKLQNH